MTNLDSILKSRNITLLTKICIVKAMSETVTVRESHCYGILREKYFPHSALTPDGFYQRLKSFICMTSSELNIKVTKDIVQLQTCIPGEKVLIAQSGPTLCNPMDCNLPDSSVHGIFQTRILKWVAISSFGGSSLGSSPGLPHYRQIPYCLSHQRKFLR